MFTFSNIMSKNKKLAPKGKYHFGRMEPVNMIIEFDGKTFKIANLRGFIETNDYKIDYKIDICRLATGVWCANAHFETEPPAGLAGPEIVRCDWGWRDL
jgi:hypothetical protein